MALRRTRQGTHPANVELWTAMFDHTNAGGVDVDAAVPIGEHGVGCPTVPELASHGDELLGPLVAVGVIQESAAAEVLPGERVRRGDNVPSRAAVRQVVERGELPCHFERFVEGGVDRACQAEAIGDRGQCRQDRERVGPAHDVEVVNATAVLTQPQPLGEEEEVEQPALGGLRQVHEGVELDLAARLRIRPHGRVVDAGEMGGQMDLLAVLPLPDGDGAPLVRAFPLR